MIETTSTPRRLPRDARGRLVVVEIASSDEEYETILEPDNALLELPDDDVAELPVRPRYEHMKERFRYAKRKYGLVTADHATSLQRLRRLRLERDLLLSNVLGRIRRKEPQTGNAPRSS